MRPMRLGTEVVVTTPADCLQLDMSSWMRKVLKMKAWGGIDWLFTDLNAITRKKFSAWTSFIHLKQFIPVRNLVQWLQFFRTSDSGLIQQHCPSDYEF